MGLGRGSDRCIHFKKEVTLGTAPAQTNAIWLPYENYDVKPAKEYFTPADFSCSRQRTATPEISRITLPGNLTCGFYGFQFSNVSVAQSVLDLWIPPNYTTLTPNSATIWWGETNDPKQHTGMTGTTLTISGQAGGPVVIQGGLTGMLETGGVAPPTKSATTPHYKRAMFKDCVLTVSALAQLMRGFTITLATGAEPLNENSIWPTDIALGGLEVIDFQIQFYKRSNTYDAMRRAASMSDESASLIIKADHMGSGTGTYTTLTVDLPKLNHQDITDIINRESFDEQTVTWMGTKPNNTNNQRACTWGVL
jgi:hypothetical protein